MQDYSGRLPGVKPAVVKIINLKNGQHGTGFVVDKRGIIITAKHIISNASNTKVYFYDGSETNCSKIGYRNTIHDLAILKIKSGNYRALRLADYKDVKEGNEVYFCGYPLSSWHHAINHGMVSSMFTRDSIKIIQIDGSVNSGNSGGVRLWV
jgi:S1-C subfamily serine protease